jgi:hypothetical protein
MKVYCKYCGVSDGAHDIFSRNCPGNYDWEATTIASTLDDLNEHSSTCMYCGWSLNEHSSTCQRNRIQGRNDPLRALGMNYGKPFNEPWRDPDSWTTEQLKAADEWLSKNEAAIKSGGPYTRLPGTETRMAGANYTRIGDAERDSTLDYLATRVSTGHITQEEFEERKDKALAARTQTDLDYLTADLPPMPARVVIKPAATRTVTAQMLRGDGDRKIPFSPVKWALSSSFFLALVSLLCPLSAAIWHGLGHSPGDGGLSILLTIMAGVGFIVSIIGFAPDSLKMEVEDK